MKILVLKGSPRIQGNTNSLVRQFTKRLRELSTQQGEISLQNCDNISWEEINLYDMSISPCRACRECQRNWQEPACVIDDDMQSIFLKILAADLIVLATPIYSWYCTAPMKALLDRCVYALNKFYGTPAVGTPESSKPAAAGKTKKSRGPSLWRGKQLALITTCGYEPEKGADLLEEGIRRYCRHSGLEYRGMLVERHLGYDTEFMDDDKAMRAQEFCDILIR